MHTLHIQYHKLLEGDLFHKAPGACRSVRTCTADKLTDTVKVLNGL